MSVKYCSTFFVPLDYYLEMTKLGFTPMKHLQCCINESGTIVDGYYIKNEEAAIIQELGIPIERA